MMRNKQDDISGTLSTVPVGRDSESIVVMCIRPTEQCLPKTYVEFLIMNNNHCQNSLLSCWHVSAPPNPRNAVGIGQNSWKSEGH